MKFKNYLQDFPYSIYAKDIRFAICEYYLQTRNYRDALHELSKYILDYQEDKDIIFAQALLYKIISEYKDQPQLIEDIKQNFFSKSLFLIFSESKNKYYKSALNNSYKITEYIDRVEVFKNNELFFKISP